MFSTDNIPENFEVANEFKLWDKFYPRNLKAFPESFPFIFVAVLKASIFVFEVTRCWKFVFLFYRRKADGHCHHSLLTNTIVIKLFANLEK